MKEDRYQSEEKISVSRSRGGGGRVSVMLLPHELVAAELLTRLPVKSLMRFKCVSKLWRSTISQDPGFYKAHHRTRRNHSASHLFITYPDADDNSVRCFYATLPPPSKPHGEEESIIVVDVSKPHQFTTTISTTGSSYSASSFSFSSSYKYNGATEVINGLFCLHRGNRSWICNVSTREIKELPFSPDLENAISFNYFFGLTFTNNDNKEYKLLKLCMLPIPILTRNIPKRRRFRVTVGCSRNEWLQSIWVANLRTYCHRVHRVFEIMTVGKDLSWRRPCTLQDDRKIDLVLHRPSVYIDGSLCFWNCDVFKLILFNFENESLQNIDPPPESCGSELLVQFRGNFALLRQRNGGLVNRKLDIWVLELNRYNKQRSYEWINYVIDVPRYFPVCRCSFLGNLPLPTGDQMLLTDLKDIANLSHQNICAYSYDDTKGKFERFVIGEFPLWSPSSKIASVYRKDTNKFRVHYYEENITPLNDLGISNNDLSFTKKKKKKKKKKKNKEEGNDYFEQRFSQDLVISNKDSNLSPSFT